MTDAPSRKDTSPGPLRVLLVEDQVVNQWLAKALLDKRNLDTTVVANGQEAIAACDVGRFDVILMDLLMPVMNGVDAIREIRRKEADRSRHTPILALTAHDGEMSEKQCLDAGADAYLTKPINVEQVLKIVEQIASASGTSPGAEGGTIF